MKIRTKIQVLSSIFLIVMLCILSTLVAISFFWLSLQREEELLEEQVELIESQVKKSNLEAIVPEDNLVRIYNQAGELIAQFSDDEELLAIKPYFSTEEEKKISRVDNEYILTYRSSFENEQNGMIEISRSIEPIIENLVTLIMVLISASFIVVLVSIIAGKSLAKLILKPVAEMSKTMVDIEQSGQFKQMDISTSNNKDELAQMGLTFNRMMNRLEKNYHAQQQFLSDASHELKTPITIIESYASMLKRWGKQDQVIQEEAIEAIHHEAIRMKRLTGDFLKVASEAELVVEQVEIVSLCYQIVRNFKYTLNRNVNIEHSLPEVLFETDSDKLEQLLIILLDNAIKYSKEDVVVRIELDDEDLRICIKDQGIGIPSEELEKVFDRFYRVDSSRTRSTGGSGLGLAIAKSLVEALGGTIKIESKVGIGTTVKLIFLSKF